ncbi:MAG: tetratricopeptide repeat protein [Theionarchaea archaeon]|nr:tetratricopeptide repeat protein [Theionarchaea archaeon]
MKIEKVVEEFLKLLSQGKVEQAEELIVGEAKGREDDVAENLLIIGAEIGNEGYYFEALCCFEAAGRVVKLEDLKEVIIQNLAIAHNNYGNLLKDMGKYEEAESHYKESLRINPEYAGAHYNYGILLQEMGKYEEAEFHYKESLRINPEYADAHYNYGNLLQDMGKYEEAALHYKESLRINPEYADAHYNYGNLLQEMGKYEEAESRYKESLRINPEDAGAHNNYGNLLQEMGKYEEAESHYKESLRINPEYAQAHNNYGVLLQDMGKYEEAELHYKESLRINPEYADAHYNYGNLLQEMGKYEEAESHYKESLRINPEHAQAHNNYGVLLKDMGKYEEAEFHYKESLRINPEYAQNYGNLGILYSDQRRYPEAIESFESASRIFREKKMLLDHRKAEAHKSSVEARIFWREESWEDTRRSLEEAIENFSACGMDYHVEISSNILYLLAIDQYFIESLTPQDLLDLRERIQDLYKTIMEFKKTLEESEIYEHRIFAAKFTCIQFLYNALTFQPLDFEDLDAARKVLRDEGFTQAVQSLNVLENFAADLDQYKSVGLENIPEEEAQRLLGKLTSMRYLDGYITAGAIQEIQKFEPWQKSQTPIECVHLEILSRNSVKVGIVQFSFNLKFSHNKLIFPPESDNPLVLKDQFLNYLDMAVKEELNIVCFPELSMTPDILEMIKERDTGDLIIIGGSYYTERMNVCPIVFRKKVRNVQKIHPSKFEFTPVKGEGMIPGDRLYLFDAHVGKFIVLVCEDFRHELHNVLSQVSNLDFIIVISYNPNPERFHRIADPIPSDHPLYILLVNVSEKGSEFGKSGIYGIIDDSYKENLERAGLRPDTSFKNEIAEIDGEGMLIAEFNIAQKAIQKPTPLDLWTVKDIRKVTPS